MLTVDANRDTLGRIGATTMLNRLHDTWYALVALVKANPQRVAGVLVVLVGYVLLRLVF